MDSSNTITAQATSTFLATARTCIRRARAERFRHRRRARDDQRGGFGGRHRPGLPRRRGDRRGSTVSTTRRPTTATPRPTKCAPSPPRPSTAMREARGDIRVTVQNDVQLRATLTVPAGPVALGSNINYSTQVCNDGNRPATSMSLGAFTRRLSSSMPMPVGTTLSATNTFPAGTLYTTRRSPPRREAAVWTNTAPGTLSTVTRVAFNAGATLAGGDTAAASFNAHRHHHDDQRHHADLRRSSMRSRPTPSARRPITDQSGDAVHQQAATATATSTSRPDPRARQPAAGLHTHHAPPAGRQRAHRAARPARPRPAPTSNNTTSPTAASTPASPASRRAASRRPAAGHHLRQHRAQHGQRQRHVHAHRADRARWLHRRDQHDGAAGPFTTVPSGGTSRSPLNFAPDRRHPRARHRARRADRADGLQRHHSAPPRPTRPPTPTAPSTASTPASSGSTSRSRSSTGQASAGRPTQCPARSSCTPSPTRTSWSQRRRLEQLRR